ncbi:non-heme iron oxygenase ferredoxin subunit [Ramlibacter sp. G-1-2-2]|uniref:Non-heme iron oxygenase ferredoxin subunit n=1 Tax=Ramlibacter agri TaxID=2728837 RepID=A0A848HBM6_9BURK|nr:non-heme iron oxygenase ferredoxin subunit [Ramlibacter agri]NML47867.1 non-heme iron oxygenase ferredoxin subunit [Ramlibacter agri]
MAQLKVAASQSLAEGEPVSVTVQGQPIMLVRWEGKPYALGDICTHQYALLSDGFFADGCIECPLHQATFDVRTGVPQCGPATVPARRFEVSEADGEVFLEFERESVA